MSEFTPGPEHEEQIAHLVSDVIKESRKYAGLYHPKTGIQLKIGEVDWGVYYSPPSSDYPECVIVMRDQIKFNNPLYYRFDASSREANKNETVQKTKKGIGRFKLGDEEPVMDTAEVELIQSIITTAHNIKRTAN